MTRTTVGGTGLAAALQAEPDGEHRAPARPFRYNLVAQRGLFVVLRRDRFPAADLLRHLDAVVAGGDRLPAALDPERPGPAVEGRRGRLGRGAHELLRHQGD